MPRGQRAPQPQERRSTEYAYELLRGRILSGELPPGATFSQAAIADSIGVSRTPLREAVRLLQTEGLLEGEPNRRLRVAAVSVADLEQLYALRITTEALALRSSVPAMTDEQADAMTAALAAMDRGALDGSMTAIDTAHREFHSLLVGGAGERFATVSSTLWDHTARYRAAAVTSAASAAKVFVEAQEEHGRILDAVKAGDADAAASALARHYERTARTLIADADPQHEPLLLEAALAAAVGSCR